LYEQLREALREYYPALIVSLAVVLLRANGYYRKCASRTAALMNSRRWVSLFALNEPLLAHRPNLFGYAFGCALLAFVLVLGLHNGNYMTYLYQLVAPPFFIGLFQETPVPFPFSWISTPLLLLNGLLLSWLLLNPAFLAQKDSLAWATLYRYVDGQGDILNSPLVVSRMIESGMAPADSGQSEYFYSIRNYPSFWPLGPSYPVVRERATDYRKQITRSIKTHEFDELILTEGQGLTPAFIDKDAVSQHYSRFAELAIEMPYMPQGGQHWTVGIWRPMGRKCGADCDQPVAPP
jgi:hypothetical protein